MKIVNPNEYFEFKAKLINFKPKVTIDNSSIVNISNPQLNSKPKEQITTTQNEQQKNENDNLLNDGSLFDGLLLKVFLIRIIILT